MNLRTETKLSGNHLIISNVNTAYAAIDVADILPVLDSELDHPIGADGLGTVGPNTIDR